MPGFADKLSQQGHTLNSTLSQGVPVVGLVTPQGSHDQADLRQRNEASTTLAKWPSTDFRPINRNHENFSQRTF